jgi:DNA-binding beta-propeller fold protein YncE
MKANSVNIDCNINPYRYLSISLLITIGVLFLSIILFSTVGALDPQAKEYVFVKKWGSRGTGDGQFHRVHDIDFNPLETRLYAVDRDGYRIQVFDKNGTFLFKWGSKGTGDGQFTVPYSVDVDSQGNVWIADRGNHRIQKFNNDGKFLFKFGSFGSKEGQFNNPRQVAVDKDVKFLYVVDSKNNRIQKFDTNGTFVKSWGTQGTGNGQFGLPVSVIMDSKGDIIVNERDNNRVQVFDNNGTFLLKFGSTGTGNGQFAEIEHMATDNFNNIYVNDPQSGPDGSGKPRVQKFDSNGTFITKWGSLGSANGQFVDPEHLAIDSEGNVYVSDRKNNNIQVFKPAAAVVGPLSNSTSKIYVKEATATLSGKDEVPPTKSIANGTAKFVANTDGSEVSYWVNLTGLKKITQAHIHDGTPGENGDIVVSLSKEKLAKNQDKPEIQLAGNITRDDLQGLLKGKEISELATLMSNGSGYVNAYTEIYPEGAIRGQILSVSTENGVSSNAMMEGNATNASSSSTGQDIDESLR